MLFEGCVFLKQTHIFILLSIRIVQLDSVVLFNKVTCCVIVSSPHLWVCLIIEKKNSFFKPSCTLGASWTVPEVEGSNTGKGQKPISRAWSENWCKFGYHMLLLHMSFNRILLVCDYPFPRCCLQCGFYCIAVLMSFYCFINISLFFDNVAIPISLHITVTSVSKSRLKQSQ